MKQLELDKTYEVEINVEVNEKMFETEVYAYIIENLIRDANEKILCKIYDRKGIKKFTVDFYGFDGQLDKSSRFIVFDRPSKLFGSNVIHFYTNDLFENDEGLFINLETLWDNAEYNHITGFLKFNEVKDYITYQ